MAVLNACDVLFDPILSAFRTKSQLLCTSSQLYFIYIYRLHLTRPTLLNPVKLTLLMLFLIFQRTRFFFNSLLMLGILLFTDQARNVYFQKYLSPPPQVGGMVFDDGGVKKGLHWATFFYSFFILFIRQFIVFPHKNIYFPNFSDSNPKQVVALYACIYNIYFLFFEKIYTPGHQVDRLQKRFKGLYEDLQT